LEAVMVKLMGEMGGVEEWLEKDAPASGFAGALRLPAGTLSAARPAAVRG
jgi:hypothetical protein